jgi:hypothetical protein
MSVPARATLVALVLSVASLAQATAAAPSNVSAQAALDWNLNAVTAVRAAHTTDGGPSRTLYQTEGLLYVSYVQAAVYDAAMKISNRYTLYHHFNAKAGNASIEAAVISAAYNTLVAYLGDSDGSLAAKYAADIARLPADKNTSRGIDVGKAASDDIVALRSNDGRNAAISDACSTDTTPGNWVCPPASTGSIQFEQTPWLAVMQPFMLQSDLSSALPRRRPSPTRSGSQTGTRRGITAPSPAQSGLASKKPSQLSGTSMPSTSRTRPCATSRSSTTWTLWTRSGCWLWGTWLVPTPASPVLTPSTTIGSGGRSPRSAPTA